ncbi:Major facilitator superfamily domain general substrate transporter [Penicillium maclennaniae]|uniref:Major facilitator superfamily domain general substrate transporter n=1 Tax=Penicillium maclennaniae TaxID=1343394 RepID=UPI002540F76A|nr:Major facilitator superfamily domain general substrate transporter [Penicillium maclennaniae]KAJ5665816.1 Major facilitator superfamily domain general substrate transporter [Penicillium maclennaniae]
MAEKNSCCEDEQPSVTHQRTSELSDVHVKPISNGGLQAWLGVLAGFCVFVNSWGILTTFGAFQEYYKTELLSDLSPSTISWIGSIQATLIPMVGIVSGPLVDSGHLRPLMISGSFLTVFGLMMTSLAREYYQVLLAQGFCVGIGGGISYIPALAVISTSFTTRRPIAIGIASIGSSVGAVIFPVMFRQLQPRIGFSWAVRCIGFVSLLMAIIACVILCCRPVPRMRARSLVDWQAFREPSFMFFSVSLTLVMLAYYVPIFYVASYARTVVHTTTSFSFYMVAIVNGSSVFGRVVPYLLVAYVKPIAILMTCVMASAIAMFAWIAARETAGFIVWACYWGILSGVLVTAPTSIVAHPVFCPNVNCMGTRLGMMWGISSFGALAGTPIAGALVNLDTANFLRAQVFAGLMMVGALLLQLWPGYKVFCHDRNHAQGQT